MIVSQPHTATLLPAQTAAASVPTPTQTVRTRPAFHYHFDMMPRYLQILRAQMRIAVVYGGDNSQKDAVIYPTFNPRPWKSYEAVANDIRQALQAVGFVHVTVMPDDMHLPQRLKDENIHLVWLNTGGVQGFNPVSHTAAMLEMLGIPYVGHDSLHASTLDNKHTFKRELQALGLPTAPFVTWHPSQGPLQTHMGSRFQRVFGSYTGPFVVKPVSGRASLHIMVVDHVHKVPFVAHDLVQRTHNTVLIETYLPGREFCVAVCGGITCQGSAIRKRTQPFAFSTVERLLGPDEPIFTSMDVKAITGNRVRLLNDDEPEREQLLRLARTIYSEFNLGALVRIDVRADAQGELQILEANPKPDLKQADGKITSLIAAGLNQFNLTYTDLIQSLLADRLDHLFNYVPWNVLHLVDLLV
jgi:D-alanine-D-alanine ligase